MKAITRSLAKLTFLALMSTVSFATYASNQHVEEGLTCSSKQQILETQIQYAKQNNETSRVQGLEKALHQVTTFCTNDKLEAKYKLDIHEKTAKVAERQKQLAEAQSKGNSQKIEKQKAKLSEAERELNEAQTKLVSFREELTAK